MDDTITPNDINENEENEENEDNEDNEDNDEDEYKVDNEIAYPNTNDDNLQSKIYKKREFYYYKMPDRPNLEDDEDIIKYRKKICVVKESLSHQNLLSNFINPNTPYKGIIAYHGTGTGKTFVGVAIGEKFKPLLKRYNTKIIIVVPGPLLKNKWRQDIITGTGDEYSKQNTNLIYMNSEERKKQYNAAVKASSEFYRILSYRSFTKKILGDKIITKTVDAFGKIKTNYKKNKNGSFDREFIGERLYDLDNSLLIIDEAHNFVGDSDLNEALKIIIRKSINLKIVLLTATPMNNYADEIIELLNFLRPVEDPIERNKMFTSKTNYAMELKPTGADYFKKMSQGYISHLRGADPLTFAKRVEIGVKPKGLMFTKLIQCHMEQLQLETYNKVIENLETDYDSLDTKASAISNFCIPILDENKKKIIGSYGNEGLTELRNQIKNNYDVLNSKIALDFYGIKNNKEEFINYNMDTQNITGKILNKKYLKTFSAKFHKILEDIEDNLFVNKKNKESMTGFCYSNWVKIGIDLFQEILLNNGYLEYEENYNKYNIKNDTICYYCGIEKQHHESSKTHFFKPATFLKITGQNNDEKNEIEQDKKIEYVNNVYSNIENRYGGNIKLLLGSKVMSEGYSLKLVGCEFIMDAYYTLGRIEQIVGRGVRWCSHYDIMDKNNMYPKVKVFKYVSSVKNNISSEEQLYAKAEIKFVLVKKIERLMKENSIDCPLNYTGNIFKEEVDTYRKCKPPNLDMVNEIENKDIVCPTQCDFTTCDFKCNDKQLNLKYYDSTTKIYKKINKNDLDYTTFTTNMARNEINYAKERIKELYIISYIYNLETILDYVKNSYDEEKKELFYNFFTYKALDELIPITQNDFNNFKDIIYDKIHKPGYLIYVDKFYIFQPLEENEKLPLYYRKNNDIVLDSNLSLNIFLKLNPENIEHELSVENMEKKNLLHYDFESGLNYYNSRPEYTIVGIIDKENNNNKSKDVFKLRDKKNIANGTKKRGTNIQSFKGSVCFNSKSKKQLTDIAKKLKIKTDDIIRRCSLCDDIRDALFKLEKYSTGEDKKTYLIIPFNHPVYKFPLNLEDRIEVEKKKINELLITTIVFKVVANENKTEYVLSFIKEKIDEYYKKNMFSNGWTETNPNHYEIIIN